MMVGGKGESLPLFSENRFNALMPKTVVTLFVIGFSWENAGGRRIGT